MKTKMTKTFRNIFLSGILLIFCTCAVTKALAQKAVLILDTSSIRIGERVQLRLNTTLPKSSSVYWPIITDTLTSAIEVASKSKIDTNATSRKEFVNYSQSIQITSFDTGFHYIPPFTIYYSYSGDTTRHELLSESVYLRVRAVEVDTTKAIRDIRGPMSAPLSFAEMAPFLGAAAILGLIIGFVWYYFWRKRMNKPLFAIAPRPLGPPWQTALQNLDLLDDKKLWQQGKIKEYYTELTDILRHYLHQQHDIDAMEMTTSEILDAYDRADLPSDARSVLSGILIQADFAKFAKASPLRNENELSMVYARKFIDTTKPIPAQTESKPSENQAEKSHLPEINPEIKA